jgi:hypothetical protein
VRNAADRLQLCRDRHCPECKAGNTAEWLEREGGYLPPVPYSHVVFTLRKAGQVAVHLREPGQVETVARHQGRTRGRLQDVGGTDGDDPVTGYHRRAARQHAFTTHVHHMRVREVGTVTVALPPAVDDRRVLAAQRPFSTMVASPSPSRPGSPL